MPVDSIETSIVDVVDVDLLAEVNARKHSTEKYDWQTKTKIVARRGFPVEICLETTETFVPSKHALYIELILDNDNYGRPEYHRKLRLETSDLFTDSRRNWSAKLNRCEGKHLFVTVTVPLSAAIGCWNVIVSTGTWSEHQQIFSERPSTFSKLRRDDNCAIYVIFNVLKNEGTVFLDSSENRDLYVNREIDYYYGGAPKGETGYMFFSHPWIHSQFEEETMIAVMKLLKNLSDGNYLGIRQRGSIVQVSRKLSYAFPTYLLFGRWDNNYEGGKAPTDWNGTSEIVSTWLKTRQHVRYAQCFVFASVFVTMMRCIGVASRSVTCIRSAHDTDQSLTVDIEYRNGDVSRNESIWNYHVWTEIWCRRNDLPIGFDGWQVVDPTPQERSQGLPQCGPMSVKALREAQVKLPYDGWFVYGEMNADVVHWTFDADNNAQVAKHLKEDVGRALLTANVPTIEDPMIITNSYKDREGSHEERSLHMRAIRELRVLEREARYRRLYANEKQLTHIEDVLISVSDIEQIEYGSNIVLKINLENRALTDRTVDLSARLNAEDHTGRVVGRIKDYKMTQHLVPQETKELSYTVASSEYAKHVTANQILSFSVSATVVDTKQFVHDTDKFYITGTAISFEQVPKQVPVNDVFPMALYFRNPLQTQLEGIELFLHSGAHSKPMKVQRFPKVLKANGKVRIRCKVRAVAQGERFLLATVKCDQLSIMTISRSILISSP
ncbi:hypothetical protein QR680_001716 [Steinernema hermaphroditum]|uniref:Transglutaminase-like domain-containing protein n=1 Tax=Steinernema hermaphroditum TaxID=289476 RepID=A0AA39GZJ9_9BILA|nr:hypothetical protein QR680_001716 [Steinernema hermaphroditum]